MDLDLDVIVYEEAKNFSKSHPDHADKPFKGQFRHAVKLAPAQLDISIPGDLFRGNMSQI